MKTLTHALLDFEKEVFDVPKNSYEVLDDLLIKSEEEIDRSTSPNQVLSQIGDLLKDYGFSYESGNTTSESLLEKKCNCEGCVALYHSIGQVIDFPLSIVKVPTHVFVRFNEIQEGSFVNWETTSNRQRDNDEFIEKYNISPDLISKGIYLKNLDENERLGLFYHRRGFLRETKKNDYFGAISDYSQAISFAPDLVEAYYHRGDAKLNIVNEGVINAKEEERLLDEAILDFSESIRINPELDTAYLMRGNAKAKKCDYKGAIKDYTHGIKLDPQDEEGYYLRGAAKKEIGDLRGAKKDFNTALFIKPDYSSAYEKLMEIEGKKTLNFFDRLKNKFYKI